MCLLSVFPKLRVLCYHTKWLQLFEALQSFHGQCFVQCAYTVDVRTSISLNINFLLCTLRFICLHMNAFRFLPLRCKTCTLSATFQSISFLHMALITKTIPNNIYFLFLKRLNMVTIFYRSFLNLRVLCL